MPFLRHQPGHAHQPGGCRGRRRLAERELQEVDPAVEQLDPARGAPLAAEEGGEELPVGARDREDPVGAREVGREQEGLLVDVVGVRGDAVGDLREQRQVARHGAGVVGKMHVQAGGVRGKQVARPERERREAQQAGARARAAPEADQVGEQRRQECGRRSPARPRGGAPSGRRHGEVAHLRSGIPRAVTAWRRRDGRRLHRQHGNRHSRPQEPPNLPRHEGLGEPGVVPEQVDESLHRPLSAPEIAFAWLAQRALLASHVWRCPGEGASSRQTLPQGRSGAVPPARRGSRGARGGAPVRLPRSSRSFALVQISARHQSHP